MKNLIIVLFSIMLGVHVFGIILTDDDSLKNQGSGVMEHQVQSIKVFP